MIPSDIQRAIKLALITGIQVNGKKIFYRSQDTVGCYVPVLTGELKSSGSIIYKAAGVSINYSAPHAAIVETGLETAIPLTGGSERVYVPTHRRKNGAVVKGHYRNVQNGKAITFSPKISKFERGPEITRIITENAAREGQEFLKRAVLKEIVCLSDDVEQALITGSYENINGLQFKKSKKA
jgi:hypothetical protein